jgi:aquaporin Z
LSVSELGEQRDDEGADRVREVSPALARALFGDVAPWVGDFSNLAYEWRRLVAELVGTFLLVLVAAGAGVVGAVSGGAVTRLPAVVAPALMVMAVILANAPCRARISIRS